MGPFKDNKVVHMLFYTLQTTYMISIGTTMRSISTVMMNEEKFIFLLWPNTEHPGNNPVKKNIIKKKFM